MRLCLTYFNMYHYSQKDWFVTEHIMSSRKYSTTSIAVPKSAPTAPGISSLNLSPSPGTQPFRVCSLYQVRSQINYCQSMTSVSQSSSVLTSLASHLPVPTTHKPWGGRTVALNNPIVGGPLFSYNSVPKPICAEPKKTRGFQNFSIANTFEASTHTKEQRGALICKRDKNREDLIQVKCSRHSQSTWTWILKLQALAPNSS